VVHGRHRLCQWRRRLLIHYHDGFERKLKSLQLVYLGKLIVIKYLIILNMNSAGSRMTWAMAKDHGFPFSTYFAKVSDKFKTPLRAVFAFLGMNLAIGKHMIFSSRMLLRN